MVNPFNGLEVFYSRQGTHFNVVFVRNWHVPPRDAPEVSKGPNKRVELLFKHLAYRREENTWARIAFRVYASDQPTRTNLLLLLIILALPIDYRSGLGTEFGRADRQRN